MRRTGRFAVMLFVATCFVMAGCIPDEFLPPDCPSCNCPSCPRCPECPECPECEVCEECEECPECPELPGNPLAGEYVFHSLTMMDPERGPMTFPFSEHGCEIGLGGNVSMSEENEGSNDFLLHLMFVVTCPDTPPEIMGEHILSGIYLFDGVNLTVMGSDMFMWFEYSLFSEDDVDYVELVPYGLGEDDENNITDITLERIGEAGECGNADRRLGHCYRVTSCTRNFATGCYDKQTCFDLGGKSWRQCNWSNDSQTHENDGPCETS